MIIPYDYIILRPICQGGFLKKEKFMSVSKSIYKESGRGEAGAWSVCLELPRFGNGVDGFYERMRDALTERAMRDGMNIFSHLSITYSEGESVSLYIDILYCRGRELVGLKRASDIREGELIPRLPRRLRGKCVYRRGVGYFVCDNFFEGSGRKAGYLRFFREEEIDIGGKGRHHRLNFFDDDEAI